MNINPLLTDPTNLTLQRRAWAKAQKERNDQLRDAFLIFLLTLPTPDTLEAAAEATTLQFQRACEEYARQQALISAAFVQQAYRVGASRAYREVRPVIRQAQGSTPAPPQPSQVPLFLLLLLGMAPNAARLRLLTARAQQSLAALGPWTSARAAEIITRALLEGWSLTQLKSVLMEQIGITSKRATLIAETELTRAHAEGQLDALEALGVKHVGAVVEFVTRAGPGASEDEMKVQRVCPKCRALAGKVFTIKQARGKIPQHPKCACRWAIIQARKLLRKPAIVGV